MILQITGSHPFAHLWEGPRVHSGSVMEAIGLIFDFTMHTSITGVGSAACQAQHKGHHHERLHTQNIFPRHSQAPSDSFFPYYPNMPHIIRSKEGLLSYDLGDEAQQ